jgi:hypothetical protein
MAMASSSAGNASSTSMNRMMRLSAEPPRKPASAPNDRADQDRKADGREADHQRDARAVEDPAEEVAHVAVGAHDVLRLVCRAAEDVDARRLALLDLLLADQHLVGRIGRNDRAQRWRRGSG